MKKSIINIKLIIAGVVILVAVVGIKHYISSTFIPAQNKANMNLVQAEKTLNDYQQVQATFLDAHKGTKYVGTRTQIYIEIMRKLTPKDMSTHSEISKAVIESVNKLTDEDLMNNAPKGAEPLLLNPQVVDNSTGSMTIPVKINGKVQDVYVKLISMN